MSTFYLLPPRASLGERFSGYLKGLFPGLDWASTQWTELAELLGRTAAAHPQVYVVYQEELPPGEDPTRALADGFGAEAGDEIIQVLPGARSGEMNARRWRLGEGF